MSIETLTKIAATFVDIGNKEKTIRKTSSYFGLKPTLDDNFKFIDEIPPNKKGEKERESLEKISTAKFNHILTRMIGNINTYMVERREVVTKAE